MAITKGHFGFGSWFRKSLKDIYTEDYVLEYEKPELAKGIILDLLVLLYNEGQFREVRWLTKKYRGYKCSSG